MKTSISDSDRAVVRSILRRSGALPDTLDENDRVHLCWHPDEPDSLAILRARHPDTGEDDLRAIDRLTARYRSQGPRS